MTITGTNDGPVAVADGNGADAVIEEGATTAGDATAAGNVLSNDTDPDATDSKTVTTPGTYVGTYGTLVLDADGAYTYTLDNEDPQTDALAQGQPASDIFNYTMRDATGATSTASLTIAITGTNDAPELVTGGTLDYTHGARQIDNALTVLDVDSPTLVGATVSIGVGFVAGEDQLGFVDQNGIVADYDEVNGVLLLEGPATVAQYQAAVRSVVYRNDAADPTLGAREISFVVDDGDGVSAPVTSTVTVSTLNEIVGTELPDIELNGTEFADRISGLGGDDQLFGDAGNDVLIGGDGATS